MTVGELTALIVALTGVAAMILAHRLGILGQKKDAQQQTAATKLQERIAAFDELESINDRLGTENTRLHGEVERLRGLIAEAEAAGNVRLSMQAHRCRERLEELIAALAVLQSVVVSEVAEATAGNVADRAQNHVETDHPDLD